MEKMRIINWWNEKRILLQVQKNFVIIFFYFLLFKRDIFFGFPYR